MSAATVHLFTLVSALWQRQLVQTSGRWSVARNPQVWFTQDEKGKFVLQTTPMFFFSQKKVEKKGKERGRLSGESGTRRWRKESKDKEEEGKRGRREERRRTSTYQYVTTLKQLEIYKITNHPSFFFFGRSCPSPWYLYTSHGVPYGDN